MSVPRLRWRWCCLPCRVSGRTAPGTRLGPAGLPRNHPAGAADSPGPSVRTGRRTWAGAAGALAGGGAASAEHQAAGCRRDERGHRHAVGQGGAVQADVCGCHPGDQRREAEPEEVDDEDGGDEPGALCGSGQRDQGAVDAQ